MTAITQLQKQELSFSISFFNKANDNKPKLNEISWRKFAALCDKPEIRQQKDGKLFSPAIFNGTRAKENVISLACLVLDYDHKANLETDTSTWKQLNYQFIAYTSHSHLRETKSNPNREERFRVVLPLALPITAKHFSQLWNWASKISLGKIDSSARDESRMFYLPVKASVNAPYRVEIFNGKLLDWRELLLEHPQTIIEVKNFTTNKEKYTFTLSENAEPPAKKLAFLLENEAKFFGTWHKQRDDLKDKSQSSLEFSLATYAMLYDWTDQETVNLLISHRGGIKRQDNGKCRFDYYTRTLTKARFWVTNEKLKREQQKEAKLQVEHSNNSILEIVFSGRKKDVRNALLLKNLFGSNLKYSKALGDWLIWDNKRWTEDELLRVFSFAQNVVRNVISSAILCKDNSDERKELLKLAAELDSDKTQKAMISQARSMLAVSLIQFDQKPYLLNCENGTFNLETNEWCKHKREDFLTRLAPVIFDSKAKCPTWLAFLSRIFDKDEKLISFVKRALGSSLVGARFKREMFILHGEGSNGKTTLLETIKSLLGDYATTTTIETLTVQKYETVGSKADIASLRGARFVTASETNKSFKLDESKIKTLTGGETVKTRKLYQNYFEFVPEFRLWIATNHKPLIDAYDKAIWDRVILIPFEISISQDEQDTKMQEKLHLEYSGILNWLIEGYQAYNQSGLIVPDKVKSATLDYRQSMDIIGDFLARLYPI